MPDRNFLLFFSPNAHFFGFLLRHVEEDEKGELAQRKSHINPRGSQAGGSGLGVAGSESLLHRHTRTSTHLPVLLMACAALGNLSKQVTINSRQEKTL